MTYDPGSRIDYLVTEECKRQGLEPFLVHSIIQVESSQDPWVIRYEPNFKWTLPVAKSMNFAKGWGVNLETEMIAQKTSWGLMQVMGAVARELGLVGPLTKLITPEVGIEYGCKQLKRLKERNKKFEDLVSAYNMGTAKKDSKGKYLNQNYVTKVLAFYDNYKKVGLV